MVIGVMGYQGGSDLHVLALRELGIEAKKVYVEGDFPELSGLIMPGGESSVQYQYATKRGLKDAISAFAKSGKPILGTCAGAILLSHYQSPKVNGFGLINMDVERNIYGRQIASGQYESDQGRQVLFIRAPGFTKLAQEIEVLDRFREQPILVRQGQIYACAFHPECLNISQDNLLYQIFGSN